MTTQDINQMKDELAKELETEYFPEFMQSNISGKVIGPLISSIDTLRQNVDLLYSYQVFITGFRLGQKCQNTQPEAQ